MCVCLYASVACACVRKCVCVSARVFYVHMLIFLLFFFNLEPLFEPCARACVRMCVCVCQRSCLFMFICSFSFCSFINRAPLRAVCASGHKWTFAAASLATHVRALYLLFLFFFYLFFCYSSCFCSCYCYCYCFFFSFRIYSSFIFHFGFVFLFLFFLFLFLYFYREFTESLP